MAKVTRLTLDRSGGLDRRRLHLREISDDGDLPLENVGQDLRAARQRKGEDLATVSRALRIRKDHLEGLEESNLEALPGRAYAIGFVRSYADYLGLDSVSCVERFKTEIAGLGDLEQKSFSPVATSERRWPQGTLILAVLLLIAVAYGGYYLIWADRMGTPTVATVPDRLSTEAAAAPAPAVRAPSAAGPAASIDSTQAEAASQAVAAPGAAELAVALPSGQAYGTRNSDSRVTLRVHAPARILVQGQDNTIFLNRALKAGDLYQAPNIVGLTLTTPDSGAVEVILDGTSLGFLGARGAMAEGLSLNPQDLVDRAPTSG